MAVKKQIMGHGDNGVLYESHYDEIEDKLIVNGIQDVQPILEQNKRERNDFDGFHGKTLVKVATIPNVIVDQLMRDGTWYDKKAMKRFLNDPDNKFLRTSTGKV